MRIESRAAVDQLDAILAVAGLDHPAVHALVERAQACARAATNFTWRSSTGGDNVRLK